MSEDGGGWTRLLTATQATSYEYVGQYGHSYTFRVQATDNVSNTGDWAEASVSVVQVTKYYAFGGQRIAMREGDVVYYLHSDHLGSTSVASTDDGALYSRQLYYPYGETRTASGPLPTDFGFAGQRSDSYIKLVQMGARWYDPQTGRWISADTIVPDFANPQNLNRYSYVRNNPVRYRDPDGHCILGSDGRCDVEATRKLYRDQWMYRKAKLAMKIMIWREQRPNAQAMEGAAHVLWNRAGHDIYRVLPEVSKASQFQGYSKGPPSEEDLAKFGEREAWELAQSISRGVIKGYEGYEDFTGGALFFANVLQSEEETYKDSLARLLQERADEWQSVDDILTTAGYGSFVFDGGVEIPKLFVYNDSLSVAISDEFKVANPRTPFSTENEWKEWKQQNP